MLITALILTYLACCLINVIYWSSVCTPLNQLEESQLDDNHQYAITILICSKDNSQQVGTLLDSLDSQINVSSMVKVLIVNDYSDPSHTRRLAALQSRFPIEIIHADQDIPGKKAALMTGIKWISSGVILLTDGDCRPRPEWIATLSQSVTPDHAALGYSPYRRQSGIVNTWIRYEGFITAIQYLGWAALRKSYMGVGRSLAFHSSSVKSLTLSDLNPSIASGDDDMLIQYLASARPVLRSTAYVDTDAPLSWRDYWRQKRRHYSISTDYPLGHQIRLSLFSISQILILIFGVSGLVVGLGPLILTVWCVRLGCIALISWRTFGRLEQRDLWFLLPLLDGLLSIYYLVFGMTFLLPKPKSW